jgi:hypothetical protein
MIRHYNGILVWERVPISNGSVRGIYINAEAISHLAREFFYIKLFLTYLFLA